MSKRTNITIVFASAIILVLLVAVSLLWPTVTKASATAPLVHTSTQELQPLVPAVSHLMQSAKPTSTLECYETSHTYTATHLFCQDVYTYPHMTAPLPASSREKVVVSAIALDKALMKNGWQADRPQDKTHTVAAAIPTSPLAAFHVVQVPFHKNVGGISCNLDVEFGGPTDGTSPGVIGINRFSCQQDISYFMLHVSNYTNQGFGG